MATFTSRFNMRKAAGADQANVQTDINDNLDVIDANLGAAIVTSGTRPASPIEGRLIRETDTGNFLVYASGAWRNVSVPVVTATSQILAPYEGLIVLNTTDMLLYRRSGSTWIGFAAVGGTTDPTRHEARYIKTVSVAVASGTDGQISYPNTVTTCSDVTPNGSFNAFTLNRGGLWILSAGVRWAAGSSGERHLFLSQTDMAVGNRVAGVSASSSLNTTLNCHAEVRLSAGAVVLAGGWQLSGGALGQDIAGSSNYFSAVWLRP